jgi:hypothetical protein
MERVGIMDDNKFEGFSDEAKEKMYRIGDILLSEKVTELINSEGLEGTEDLIKRVLASPDLRKLKDTFLKELYARWYF